MAYNINKDNSIKHECITLSNLLNIKKRATYKVYNYSPIVQVCMNNRRGKEKFRYFRILLD